MLSLCAIVMLGGLFLFGWLVALRGDDKLDANHARHTKRVSCVTLQCPSHATTETSPPKKKKEGNMRRQTRA
jgi:hypothetical protein